MTQRPRKSGEFCWFNLITRDPKAEKRFFTQLLHWDYFSMGDMGDGVQVNGEKLGGFFDVDHPNTPPNTAPQMGVMIKVDDVDKTLERVTQLGGRNLGAMTIATNGRMGMVEDPTGARFDLWQPMSQASLTPTQGVHGNPAWWELITRDTQKAGKFYMDLFGWTPREYPAEHGTYTSFWLDDWGVGGMMNVPPHMKNAMPDWSVYFNVTDVDACAAQAKKLGGSVCVEPSDIPGIGRYTGIKSPEGVLFYAAKFVPPSA